MTNRTRRAVRSVLAVLAALAMSFGVAAIPYSATADTIPTTTSLSITGGYQYGDPITYTATVTSDSGTPTGTVTFSSEGTTIAADVPVDANGVAEYTGTTTALGLSGFTAAFTGTGGYGDSTGFTLHQSFPASLVLKPEPSVLEISRRNPLKITLTLSAYATRLDGTPIVGESLTFSVLGKQPNLFDFGGGTVICQAVTNAQGFASCGGAGIGGAVVSLLAGGSYVTHFNSPTYFFNSAKAKVIILGGP